jgi:teichuronic acid biosynthesis glycosyltransferase TuaG
LNRIIKAPKDLIYRQFFYCKFIGNLAGIYSTDYFGKIDISDIRKQQDWIIGRIILKKNKKSTRCPLKV